MKNKALATWLPLSALRAKKCNERRARALATASRRQRRRSFSVAAAVASERSLCTAPLSARRRGRRSLRTSTRSRRRCRSATRRSSARATAAVGRSGPASRHRSLDTASKGRTCVTIAHLLSTIQPADFILVVDAATHTQIVAQTGKRDSHSKAEIVNAAGVLSSYQFRFLFIFLASCCFFSNYFDQKSS